jgi:hypothetical protein
MKRILTPMAVLGLLLVAVSARAQFPGTTPDTFRLQLGGMYAFTDTTVQFTQTTGAFAGQSINLENVSGLPTSKFGFQASGYWNFAGRSFLDFSYINLNRTRTRTISRDIIFGDTTFTAGASVTSSFKSSYPYLAYHYGFVKSPTTQFGASLGLAYVTMEAKLSASAGAVGPGGGVGGSATKTAKEQVPVPLLGLQFQGQLAPSLSAGIDVKGAAATITPYHGSMIDASAHIDWYFAQNFGFGLGYEYTKLDIKKTNSTSTIKFDYQYDGPKAYVVLTF